MKELQRVRQHVLTHFARIIESLDRELPEPMREAVDSAWDRLNTGQYRVVVCGEFKRGKSTLLNALTRRPGLFPVAVDVATSTVITLSYAEKDTATIYFGEDPERPGTTRPPLKDVPLDRLADYATENGNPLNAKNVIRVEIGMPLPELESGLVLIDTPGIGSMNPGHAAVTRAEVLMADALIFVTSAVEGLSTGELDFLADSVAVCPNVITAVTFIDKVVDPSLVITESRKKLADIVGATPQDLIVVGVSSLRQRIALKNDDEEQLTESGYPELEHQLWGRLADTCGRAQILRALDVWEEMVETVRQPKAEQLATLLTAEPSRLATALAAAQSALAELEVESRDLPQRISRDLELAARPVAHRLNTDFDELSADFVKATHSEEGGDDPAGVAKRFSTKIVDVTARAGHDLTLAAKVVALKYGLTKAFSDPEESEPAPESVSVSAQEGPQFVMRAGPSTFVKMRTAWAGSQAYREVGAVSGAIAGSVIPGVGTLVGAVVGGVVGQVTGWFAGRNEVRRQHDAQRRQETVSQLREYLLPKLHAARRTAERDLTHDIRDYSDDLSKALRAQLATKRALLTTQADDLTSAAQDSAQQRTDRVTDLRAALERHTRLLEENDALRTQLDAVSPPNPAQN